MKKAKSSFKGKVTGASERRAKEAFSYGYLKLPQGVPVFLPVPGKTVTLDFLPYEVTMKNHPDKYADEDIAMPGTLWYRLPFKVHRNIGTKKDSVVCLASFGKKCPICEYKIKRGKEGADKDELGALRASDRFLYVVNPLDSDKFDAGKAHVFDISNAMFQKLLDEELKEEAIPEDFMDPTDGVSLKIRFSSETIGTSKPFAEAKKITTVERKKAYKDAFLDTVPKLDELLTIMSYDELEAKFFELDQEPEDDDKDEKPVGKKKIEEEDDEPAPVRKKKPVPEPEPEPEMSWEELELLTAKQLIKYCKANDLEVDYDDFEGDEDGLREAIAEELEIELPKKKTKPAPEPIAKKDRCPDCNGTGKNAKGGVCKTCMGTGKKQAEPEEEEEEAPAPTRKPKAPKTQECPSGYVFGKDTDKEDECDSCDLWDECMAAKKAAKK